MTESLGGWGKNLNGESTYLALWEEDGPNTTRMREAYGEGSRSCQEGPLQSKYQVMMDRRLALKSER